MTLTSNQRNWFVFSVATLVTGVPAAIFLNYAGSSDENMRLMLRLSAQASFLTLLLIFVARPLRQLFSTPFSLALLRNRRLLGITFAGIHTAHLGLIIHRIRLIPEIGIATGRIALGLLTYVVVYAMFFTSFDATARALGRRNWRILHKTGLYLIFAVATSTLLPDSLHDINWPIFSLIAVALIIRLTAFFAKQVG